MEKQNKIIMIGAFLLCLAIMIYAFSNKGSKSVNYDNFAQCLTNNAAVFYGAEWCSHCKEEKNTFGESFKFINYVECPQNTQICIDKGIKGYPTWIIGTSTDFIEGFDKNTTFKQLSERTGCELPIK